MALALAFASAPLCAQPAATQSSSPAASETPIAAPDATPAQLGQTSAAAQASPQAPAVIEAPAATNAPAPEPAKAEPQPSASLAAATPADLSPWGMFLHADRIVKGVMIGLAFASLVTWTIWLVKSLDLWRARASARRDLEAVTEAEDLRAAQTTFKDQRSPVARFVEAARSEEDRSRGLPAEGVKERIAALLVRLESHAGRKMARGTSVVATIGATAPFVGLFGTVWGIMDSFIGISKSHTTNLAVVAPGIAEALLATAMGLIAAIPAVMIYNVFARGITGYKAQLGDAAAEVLRHVSRDLDRAALSGDEPDRHVIAMRRPAE
ncbi:tonB-system energizer ExbB [Methylocella silvestris]|uniref:tonB-system energizer ExbB n=1 Tax=Methylocella silvestris TaxID=199596 RepID=UPI001FCB80E5|nr:tonB-system energizer ExbB [Methylocella silvestris]